MSGKKVKRCGECGEELEGEGYTVWKGGKVIMRYCEECCDKPEVKQRIRNMGADAVVVKDAEGKTVSPESLGISKKATK